MKCLAIIAHGSRNQAAILELNALASATQTQLAAHYDSVDACYLELATPSLPSLCAHLYQQGASQIDVYPLFLNSGKHASEDIPQLVSQLRLSYPHIHFTLLPYLGQNPAFAKLVADHIRANI